MTYCGNSKSAEVSERNEPKVSKSSEKTEQATKVSPNGSSPTSDSVSKAKDGSIPDKAVALLKKKPPVLTDKELNPEFFQKLERGTGELAVEVVVPRRHLNTSNSTNEVEPESMDSKERSNNIGNSHAEEFRGSFNSKYRNIERGIASLYSKQRDSEWAEERMNGKDTRIRAVDVDDRTDINQRESSSSRAGFSKTDGQSDGSFASSKGNWMAIQRQLLQLERQQVHLMSMLQVL